MEVLMEYLNEIIFGIGASIAAALTSVLGYKQLRKQTPARGRRHALGLARYLRSSEIDGREPTQLTIGQAMAYIDQHELNMEEKDHA